MDLLAITAQLSVINGAVLNETSVPGLLAQPAPPKAARGRERDFLFVHLTLTGRPEETAELAAELAEGLGQSFFAASGGVTSALRRSVLEVNERLLRYNVTNKSTHEGALNCAVLHGGGRDSHLYSLQVGEGLAFLGHNFGVERLPAKQPDVSAPLGRSAGVDMRFAFHQLQSGDMMLLADPRLAWLNGESLAPVLVDTEIESGLESLMDVMSADFAGDTARLLLIEFLDELPSTLPLVFQHSRRQAPKPAPARSSVAPDRPTTPAAATVRVGPIRETAHLSPLETKPSIEPAETNPSILHFPLDTSNVAPSVELGARRAASSSARGLSRFTAWLADVLGRLLRDERDEPAVHWAVPTAVALLVPIVMASVLTSVFIQRGAVAEISRIRQAMMVELAEAEAAGIDSSEAQTHYLQVLSLAGAAEALREGDPEVARMRTQANDALDRLDGVTRLTASPLYRYKDGANLTRIALRKEDGGIVVLDQLANRVLLHSTDVNYQTLTTAEPKVIVFGGQAVGARIVGSLFDIVWMPAQIADKRDGIGMLDRSGNFFNYFFNKGDIINAALDSNSEWKNPVAMATYLNRIYVLDSGAGVIWKYYDSANYAQLPEDAFIKLAGDADLDQAVDFDLFSDDGSLVVLYGDGRIRYYDTRSGQIQWDETATAQNGLAVSLVAPTSVKLVGTGLNTSIFVLDPGIGRLVQFSRGGDTLAQYRILDKKGNDILSQASDFDAATSPRRIVVVSSDQIYLVDRN